MRYKVGYEKELLWHLEIRKTQELIINQTKVMGVCAPARLLC